MVHLEVYDEIYYDKQREIYYREALASRRCAFRRLTAYACCDYQAKSKSSSSSYPVKDLNSSSKNLNTSRSSDSFLIKSSLV